MGISSSSGKSRTVHHAAHLHDPSRHLLGERQGYRSERFQAIQRIRKLPRQRRLRWRPREGNEVCKEHRLAWRRGWSCTDHNGSDGGRRQDCVRPHVRFRSSFIRRRLLPARIRGLSQEPRVLHSKCIFHYREACREGQVTAMAHGPTCARWATERLARHVPCRTWLCVHLSDVYTVYSGQVAVCTAAQRPRRFCVELLYVGLARPFALAACPACMNEESNICSIGCDAHVRTGQVRRALCAWWRYKLGFWCPCRPVAMQPPTCLQLARADCTR